MIYISIIIGCILGALIGINSPVISYTYSSYLSIAIVAALVIAVVSLGIAFAAFSTTLNVNGSATVQTSSWDIYFTGSSGGTKPTSSTALPSGNISGTAQSKTGSIVATTLTWNASFKAPGEYAIFKVYVKND